MKRLVVLGLLASVVSLMAWALASAGGGFVKSGVVRLEEPSYTLAVDRASLRVSILSADGATYTTMPLTAVAGASALPSPHTTSVTQQGSVITAAIIGSSGLPYETAVLHAYANAFTVDFTVDLGSAVTSQPRFFFDGSRGLDLSGITEGYSPDPGAPEHNRLPALFTDVWTPLAPPPMDLEMKASVGWFGVGLVQVPNATRMAVDGSGAIVMDYPLQILRSIKDVGNGGSVSRGVLTFPSFVVTFGQTPIGELRSYHDALVTLGAAPAAPPTGPAWWRRPIADTWGEQVADGAYRDSPRFTAAWVAQFVQDWRARFGIDSFTVVIDSRWQQQLGGAEPDRERFGSWNGLRALIDSLHRQGLKVVLWWPMWGLGTTARSDSGTPGHEDRGDPQAPQLIVDPTAAGFENQIADLMTKLLGNGPADLNADGLKLDWAYNIPQLVSQPALGWGDAALYRYLATVQTQAHRVRPDAYVESSAPSPQFAGVADGVRLYDAWSEADWEERAAIVGAADPGALIDGDGWDATQSDALVHAVTSSVYGVPAGYFADHWADGTAISPALEVLMGTVMQLAPDKGSGEPVQLPSGEWCFLNGTTVSAATFASRAALIVWGASQMKGAATAELVTTRGGRTTIPIAHPGAVSLLSPTGQPVATTRVAGGIAATLQAGIVYRLIMAASNALQTSMGCG